MKSRHVAVALDSEGEIAFAGIGDTHEEATEALARDMKFAWSNLTKDEQKDSPYYGKYEWFEGNYDIRSGPAMEVKVRST